MTQPVQYTRGYSFTDFASGSPNSQPPGTKLDQEFDGVAQTLRQTLANLAVIQRDDTQLRNGIVGVDQLSPAALALVACDAFTVRGPWVTATAYAVGDIVSDNGVVYLCMQVHTAGVLVTDVAAGKMLVMFDAEQADRVRDTFTGDGVTTTWTLSQEPVRPEDVQVFVNGLLLEGGDYAVAGDELTITPAVTSSFPIEVFTIFKDSMTPLTEAQIVSIVNAAAANAVKGDSAYQVWLNEGNSGTEDDFLAAIATNRALASAIGVTGTATNMGTFTSPLIDDNTTTKAALESIGTNLAASAGAANVGMIQAGTGAVARTAQAKLREPISVADFGADSTGLTTCGAEINAALAYAFTFVVDDTVVPSLGDFYKGSTTVLLGPGTYDTSDEIIEIPFGVTLAGAGSASTVIKSSIDDYIVRNAAEGFGDGTYDKYGLSVRDLCIVGDRTQTNQKGLGLLRSTSGQFENIKIVKCGGNALEVRQCLHSYFANIECNQNVGHGLLITEGFDGWDDAGNNLPSNANMFVNYHAASNDGAGVYFGPYANGNRFYNCTAEYNYSTAGNNVGFQIESRTTGYSPNVFFGLWTEGPAQAHVYCNNTDGLASGLNIFDWNHFGAGASGSVDRALIVEEGTVYVERAYGLAESYKTISGSNAPFRIADTAASYLTLIDPVGSTVTGMGNVEAPDYSKNGLQNNLWLRDRFAVYGNTKNVFAGDQTAAEEWYTATGLTNPYLRVEPFYKSLAFGNGSDAPDVMLLRTGLRKLGLDTRGGAQYIDAGSTWNGNHLLMGAYHLWVDSAGDLRIKSGEPASDTDGTVVGAQT